MICVMCYVSTNKDITHVSGDSVQLKKLLGILVDKERHPSWITTKTKLFFLFVKFVSFGFSPCGNIVINNKYIFLLCCKDGNQLEKFFLCCGKNFHWLFKTVNDYYFNGSRLHGKRKNCNNKQNLSPVMCQLIFFFYKLMELVSGGSVINRARAQCSHGCSTNTSVTDGLIRLVSESSFSSKL